MITITEIAQKKIVELMEKSEAPVQGLRIGARSVSPIKVDYKMAFVSEDQQNPDDKVVDFDGFTVHLDPDSAETTDEATVDFVDGLTGSGFKIDRPQNLPPGLDGTIVDRIMRVIDEQINPGLASHGGRISLIDVKKSTAYVQLEGGCQGCGMAQVTLKEGVEVMIKEAVPEIEQVLDVTEHGDGTNPYYQT